MGDSIGQHENPDSPAVLLRRLHRWRMAFFGLVILLAGMLSGAATTLLVLGHVGRDAPPPPVAAVKQLLARIGPGLHLSEEQMRQVRPILVKHVQRLDEIWQKGRADIVEEIKGLNAEMLPVLDQEQARLWQQYLRGLPGEIRHVPDWYGPGPGRGPGFRRRAGPGGPLREPVPRLPAGPPPEANAVPHQQ
jgi:hypothetical protein